MGKIYTLVIFGSTGDLTKRKLIPALYNLEVQNSLPENFQIICIGRRNYTNLDYISFLKDAVKEYSRFPIKINVWDKFSKRINYLLMNYTDNNAYHVLKNYLDSINKEENQFIYYLAVSPEHFEIIINNLKEYGLEKINNLNPRLVIEKPFGKNLKTAKLLNEKIVSVFGEENTYRIDHYLGKEMLQNIMVIRFSNQFFEPVWNNKYIKRVIINSMETIGVGSRGNYFENFGIIRDMVQSHLLQLLSLIAMEKPKSLNTNDVRDEKIKVLKALKPFTKLDFENNIIRGQYKSYRNEANINPNSTTETFVAFKTYLKNKRWNDVPFIIRTGKKLSRKSTEIIIEFKDIENNL